MHNIKDFRKNIETFKKKLKDRNSNFNIEEFNKLDELNRKLINEKEKLEQDKKSLSKSKDKSNFDKSKKISAKILTLSKKQDESQNKLNEIDRDTFNMMEGTVNKETYRKFTDSLSKGVEKKSIFLYLQ